MNGRTITYEQHAALREAIDMPETMRNLAAAARADLHYGPDASAYADCDVTGWDSAIDALRAWCASEIPSRMWLDTQADQWLDTEPSPWTDEDGQTYEPEWSDYREYGHRALVRELFGHDLAEYL